MEEGISNPDVIAFLIYDEVVLTGVYSPAEKKKGRKIPDSKPSMTIPDMISRKVGP